MYRSTLFILTYPDRCKLTWSAQPLLWKESENVLCVKHNPNLLVCFLAFYKYSNIVKFNFAWLPKASL